MKDCNHCGKCCIGSPCGMAEKYKLKGKPGGPCPALVKKNGKY